MTELGGVILGPGPSPEAAVPGWTDPGKPAAQILRGCLDRMAGRMPEMGVRSG
ncbi:hypothetical protein ACGFJ7_34020 [Actinoplanes sp. NPDC048988]|uniref:hypothetical protein n=1 Tax=Actinoplanes sp. NPDC048988 TaxID=3363901 RepID=UPI0037102BCA